MIQVISIIGAIYLAATAAPSVGSRESVADPTARTVELVEQAGLKVIIDPATGRILENPTSTELRSIGDTQAISVPRRSSWELRSFPLPGGGEGVVLDKWAHHSLNVKRTKDGGFWVQCAQGNSHESEGSRRQEQAENER